MAGKMTTGQWLAKRENVDKAMRAMYAAAEEAFVEKETRVIELEDWNKKLQHELAALHSGDDPRMLPTLYGIPFDAYRDFLIAIYRRTGIYTADFLAEREKMKARIRELEELVASYRRAQGEAMEKMRGERDKAVALVGEMWQAISDIKHNLKLLRDSGGVKWACHWDDLLSLDGKTVLSDLRARVRAEAQNDMAGHICRWCRQGVVREINVHGVNVHRKGGESRICDADGFWKEQARALSDSSLEGG